VEEYVVRRYASVVVAGGRLKRSFHRAACDFDSYVPDFSTFIKQRAARDKLHDIILVDQVLLLLGRSGIVITWWIRYCNHMIVGV
jgi:hypothetical protein